MKHQEGHKKSDIIFGLFFAFLVPIVFTAIELLEHLKQLYHQP